MASSSSSCFASAFSSWSYHVFVSFRGEDTRNTFVGHLYSALEQEGIYTYKDDETLPRGESIFPTLIKAIEESQIAVIVFSKNYGDSSWCLDELAHIMKCRDTRGQIVMPIFYDVDPSEVRKQILKFGEAFAKHELENKTKVESWRKALVDASNIAGWEPKNIANGHEAKGIKQIVVEISQKLQPLTSNACENLVGMAARLHALKLELQIGSSGVRMIGIWGVGGGGKTTLASFIFDEIFRQFDACCFVQNVREESSRYGLGKLKEKILSEMKVNKVGGRCLINNRFRHTKILLVLDDVDSLEQLKELAGSHDWFGEGSRIIITTRDKHLLTAHKVSAIHNIRLLNNDEAFKLFCKHAPLDNRSMEDYEHLSRKVISYAGGLPLALTVLGSFLCDKDINEWKSALARLKEIPDTDIVGKIKISFDGLKPVEKELFLDIACFFRREVEDKAMRIFDACGFHPVIGVKVLIHKALITISGGRFDMHDLVQEMGHHIARGGHPNNPEKHSRIWKEEDVLKICSMDATTELDIIEAITFKYNKSLRRVGPLQHLPPIVANTKNLRWIEWEGDLASPLLTNFPQRTLCCLMLNNSLQKQLWEGYKLLPNLKTIELWGLNNLIMTPDFDGLRNLETFKLGDCSSLEEIHPSIGCLERLVSLSIRFCSSLKIFPRITQLKKLETVSLSSCPNLFDISEIQQQKMENIPHLHPDNSGKEVASYQITSKRKTFTWLTCCCSNNPGLESLEEPCLPHNNMKPCLPVLQFFQRDLLELNLNDCGLGDEEIGSAVWELPNLKTLDLSSNKFSRLSFSSLRLPRLKFLNLANCWDLMELLGLPSSIAVVIAIDCHSLENFGDILKCKWLWKVSLLGADNFVGDMLLDSMLQGNAFEYHFISVALPGQIPKRFLGRVATGKTFTLCLPTDWYNKFCGFLICVVTEMVSPVINIAIKQETDEDSLFELLQESNEAVDPEYYPAKTFVGYVSFGSLLRHSTAFSNSPYNMISFSGERMNWSSFRAELVPRRSEVDSMQTTTKVAADCSEFWDEEFDYRKTFRIQHDSESSIKIIWRPL